MIRFLARGLLFSFMALLLASCDSGNDSIDVPGLSGYTLTLQTVNATTGVAATQTSAASPLRVVATLQAADGSVVTGATVQFSATGIGVLATPTGQTDGAGVVSVVLNAGTSTTPGVSSPGVVTARFVDPAVNIASDSQAYTTLGDETSTGGGGGGGGTPTNVLRMTMAALNASTRAPISATNPISTDSPGVLSVLVTLDGVAVPNALVSFTAPSVAALSQASVATNASGTAEVGITAVGNGAGVASATATVGAQQVSASIVVSSAVTATAPVTLALGNGVGGGFTSGSLLSSAGAVAVAAGSTITISADVVNTADNSRYETPVTVTFASSCSAAGTSDIDSSAMTVGGHVDITYTPNSCAGTDTITATLRDGARTLTATANVSIQSPVLGQVAFLSATPTSIALAGTGGLGRLTRSEVKFRVLSTTGAPIANQLVCFGLSTTVGGLVVNASTRTNTAGEAIAAVQAGSIPTSVRVQATVDSDGDGDCATVPATTYSAVSDALSVSTGLPDQNSFSLAASVLSPLAWNLDGTEVTITVLSADHFNNPVPDGTAISFWTELGSIQSACVTVGGGCSVKWRSQQPRENFDDRGGAVIGTNIVVGRAINDRRGRTSIIAYAVGEESFSDINGNGRFDDGEPFTDLGEVIKDSNENCVVASDSTCSVDRPVPVRASFESEEFVDFNGNGVRGVANTRYDGVLCAPGAVNCSGDASVSVRRGMVIVMSSATPRVYALSPGTFNASAIDYAPDGSMTGLPPLLTGLGGANGQTVDLIFTDTNGNSLPAGTVISASTSDAKVGTVTGTTSFTIPSQTEYYRTAFTVKPPDDLATAIDGSLIIKVSAGGLTTEYNIPVDN